MLILAAPDQLSFTSNTEGTKLSTPGTSEQTWNQFFFVGCPKEADLIYLICIDA